MPFTVTMPKLSPTMDEGTVAKWHKKVGDHVLPGELLIDVATDKATIEFNALDEGWLRQILIPEGSIARINQAIALFGATEQESLEGYKPEGLVAEKPPEVEGLSQEKGEAAPKLTHEARAGFSLPAFVPEPPLESYSLPQERSAGEKIVASPLAKRLAKEQGLDLSAVKGSGPHGRIVAQDLAKAGPASPVAFGKRERPSFPSGEYEEEPLSPMRKVIGQRLQQSKTFVPHFYLTQEMDADPLLHLREELKAGGIKLTVTDFMIRAVALALREKSVLNSGYNTVSEKIIRFKTIDISVAVSVEGGLITPIVRYADFKSIAEISLEVKELAKKARAGKLKPEEYKGGSFTISNLGMYGVSEFIAVINPPQSSILAIAGVQERPVVRSGSIVIGHTINLTLSCDHRVVDGAMAAEYLATLKKYLEHPSLLLI